MDLSDAISAIATQTKDKIGQITSEEATKNAFVMRLIQALGYDVFNPTEVIPEFTADVAGRRGEKVDYAIQNNDKISILIECKKVGEPLGADHAGQLFRYFSVTEARFGILTNGIQYEFYSDLDEQNKMDSKPFFVFDLYMHSDGDIKELKKFAKAKYVEDSILSAANDLKYARLLDAEIAKEFDTPSDDLVRLLCSRVYDGKKTSGVMEWMSVLVKEALTRNIRTRVRQNLESALDKGSEKEIEEEPAEEEESNGIITTDDEIEAYNIIRAICSEIVEPDRIYIRDHLSYCAILFDDTNRQPIARLYLEGRNWRVGTFSEKVETRHDIDQLSDIFKLGPLIKQTIGEYA